MIDFLTKIVVLITAVVVLVSSVRKNKGEKTHNTKSTGIGKYFEPFFAMLGAYGPMLAILLVMFLFRVLMDPTAFIEEIGLNKEKDSSSISIEYTQNVDAFEFYIDGPITEYENYYNLYQAAKSISYSNEKDKYLTEYVSFCLENEHIDFALLGALDISYSNKKDENLTLIVEKALDNQYYKIAVISAQNISYSNKKDDQLKLVFQSIVKKLEDTLIKIEDSNPYQ